MKESRRQSKRAVMDRLLLLHFASLFLLFSAFAIPLAGSQGIGVNYGMKGDNLPSPTQVISLYKSRNISKLRLFDPDTAALGALQNSGIGIILGTYNEDLEKFAGDPSAASSWVHSYIIPYTSTVEFRFIDVGNELIPGDTAAYVLPAMRNIAAALSSAGVHIPVTTAVSTKVLENSFPPSQGAFSYEASQVLGPIISFLASNGSPLLVNVYPFFAYSGDPNGVGLDYSLFTANDTVVQDGSLGYSNLFDAMVDSVYSAIERLDGTGVGVVVSETGWPSAGGETGATVDNARIYNNNLVKHVKKNGGTPKWPGKQLEVYMFAMFNENQKLAGIERNFGLFYPDMTEVYHVNF
ncbi:putative glucan endo-1,3-beta-glucosidase GVI [Phalaenopsis equestris]|uniref:putative glucan endo-1,3-beta-glucosidase GVI n=1 Tax=Phalaenopsis equestris TaxID=78828 RepID=UPI0009E2667C|nr:putative glucan endo-1,3-beta-glucosidase GVI [Phalaenopsis equestris]